MAYHFAAIGGRSECGKGDCFAVVMAGGVSSYLVLGAGLAWQVADHVFRNCMDQMSNATPAVHKQHCMTRSNNTLGMTIGLIYGIGCLTLVATGAACCIVRKVHNVVNKDGYEKV